MYRKGSNSYRYPGYGEINASSFSQPTKSYKIDKFLGVDFTKGEFITDVRRSPDAINTLWGNNPFTFDNRRGKKKLLSTPIVKNVGGTPIIQQIYGIHYFETFNEVLVHAGTQLIKYPINNGELGTSVEVYTDMNNAPSISTSFDGVLYILDGKNYLMYDGVNVEKVSDNAYIPTTIKSGVAFEEVNMLTSRRINSYSPKTRYSKVQYSYTPSGTGTQTVDIDLKYIPGDDGDEELLPINKFKAIDYILVNESEYITTWSVYDAGSKKAIQFDIRGYSSTVKIDINVVTWEDTFTLDSDQANDPIVRKYNLATNQWEVMSSGYTITSGSDGSKADIKFTNPPTIDDINMGIDTIEVEFSSKAISIESGSVEKAVDRSTSTQTFDIPINRIVRTDSTHHIGFFGRTSGIWERIDGATITEVVLPNGTHQIRAVKDGVSYYNYVKIEYYYTERQSYAIEKCTQIGVYGGENDMRIFFTGNPDVPNKDWYCGLYDPTYIPDLGYTYIGTKESAIMGYIKQYDTQIVIKESSQVDTSAWLRTYSIDGNGKPKFPIEQGSVGTGAISKRAFAYLNANPLFLSKEGVMKVSGTNVDYQRLIQNVSEKINTKLLKEPNLENAIGIEYKDKYYLFVNSHVYVADARMIYEDALGVTQYEWMYWDGMPATAASRCGDYLFIGYDGMIWRLKLENEYKEFEDDDYLVDNSRGTFRTIESSDNFDQLIIDMADGIYWYSGKNRSSSLPALTHNQFYKLTSYPYSEERLKYKINELIDNERNAVFKWVGENETFDLDIPLVTDKYYLVCEIDNEWTISRIADSTYIYSRSDECVSVENVTNTWQSHEIIAYWTTPKFILGSLSIKKKFKDLFVLFNKTTSVKCNITAFIDSDYKVDFGSIERLNMSEYDTAVYKEKINIESLDNISMRFEKVVGGATQNASFGIEIIQITYQLKDNF